MLASAAVMIGCVALLYAAACVYLYTQQDSFLFFPQQNAPELAHAFRETRVEIPTHDAAGDAFIEAFWAKNPHAPVGATVLYFGGNAEDVLWFASGIADLPVRRLLVSNYRGFGNTPGKLSEAAAYADGLAVYDYVVTQPEVDRANVIVIGRSLGSGIATYIAAHRPVARVVLITPYDSIAAVAQGHYPVFPVRALLRNRFPSDSFATAITAPVLMIAAQDDRVIPPSHAQHLFDVWKEEKRIEVLEGVGHNDVDRHPCYRELLDAFLTKRVE
jgi:pimeloyl-ACP methyl ester carboxylesterase